MVWSLRDRPASRRASNSGSRSIARRRLSGNPVRASPRARCRLSLARPARAFALKVRLVASIRFLPWRADRRNFLGHAGEHLGDVTNFDPPALPIELARHIEQTAEIPSQNRFGAGGDDVGFLVGHHLVGDLRVFDAKGATKAAAQLGPRQLLQPDPGNRCKEQPRLKLDPELAQPRAGIVVGYLAMPLSRNASHPADIDEKRCELPGAAGELLRARQGDRIVREKHRVVLTD